MRPQIRQILFGKTPAFNPSRLFAAGEQGVWYDPSDFSTMFQDAAGTTPVTAIEQPVGLILDKSGRGNHASQSTTTSRPILRNLYNLLQYTEQFDNAAWPKIRSSAPSTTATLNPIGGATSNKLTEGTQNGAHAVSSTSVSGAGSYTFSVYIKAAERTKAQISLSNDDTGSTDIVIDLSAGTISAPIINGTGWANTSGAIESAGNGWYKCYITSTGSASVSKGYVYTYTTTVSYQGDGTSGVYLWGASLVSANEASLPYQRVVTNTLGSGVYNTDLTKFKPYLYFDGTDDWLQTSNINFSATDKMTVWAGVRKLVDSPAASLVVLGADYSVNGAFEIGAPWSYSTTQRDYIVGLRGATSGGTAVNIRAYEGYNAPITNVISAALSSVAANSSTSQSVRFNSVSVSGTQLETLNSTGNFANAAISIGARPTGVYFNGRIYSLIVRGALTSSPQLEQTERWVANKTGVTL